MKVVGDGSGYDSHLDVLNVVLGICKPKTAIEFGMGKFSTPTLLMYCNFTVSVEMQSEAWYDEVVRYCKLNGICRGWFPIRHITDNGNIDIFGIFDGAFEFSFVDGHGKTRPDCVNACMNASVPTIVAHDTETNWYRWDKVNGVGYRHFRYSPKRPFTDVYTKNNDIISSSEFFSIVKEVQ